MSGLLNIYLSQFLIFTLVLTRLTGLMLTAPVFSSRSTPMQIRALLAVAIAMMITPLYWDVPLLAPGSLVELLVVMSQELLIGLSLGVGVMILFSSLQLTGQVIGQMSGMQLADVVDPNSETSVSVFAQLLDLIALAVFLIIGGHREVLNALLDTFQWMPPGDAAVFSEDVLWALVQLLQTAFLIGVRMAAPIMTALLISMLILGLISRTLPQLNILAIGFNLNTMVLMSTLAVSMGAIVWVFQDQVQSTIDGLRRVIVESAPR